MATSPGTPRTTRSWRRPRDRPLEPPEGARPRPAWISDSWPQSWESIHFHESPCVATCSGHSRTLTPCPQALLSSTAAYRSPNPHKTGALTTQLNQQHRSFKGNTQVFIWEGRDSCPSETKRGPRGLLPGNERVSRGPSFHGCQPHSVARRGSTSSGHTGFGTGLSQRQGMESLWFVQKCCVSEANRPPNTGRVFAKVPDAL